MADHWHPDKACRMTTQTIGVTGPNGFIASYLIRRLQQRDDLVVRTADREVFADESRLDEFVGACDIICHIAGVNRGTDDEVTGGNVTLAQSLVASIGRTSAKPHLIFASSTQRDQNSPYGLAKKSCEQILLSASDASDFRATILVIPNVYGPGCKPFYNSVVATFSHQLAQGEQPSVHEDRDVCFIHVNDVVDAFETKMTGIGLRVEYLNPAASVTVSGLLEMLSQFQSAFFGDGIIPDQSDPLTAGLYSTFLSYVDLDKHRHRPKVHVDERGALFEIIKLANGGQVFFSTTKPGVVRGNHFHTRKYEWFCVVQGSASIRLRHIHGDEVREFRVSGADPEFISIPALYTHHIENVGDEDLLTMFWCNEIFSADDPDTFYQKVA